MDKTTRYLDLLKDFRKEINPLITFLPDEAKQYQDLSIIVLIFRRAVHTLDTIEYLLRESIIRNNKPHYYYADTTLATVRRILEDLLVFKDLVVSTDKALIVKNFHDFETKELYDMNLNKHSKVL